ncbi:MAG: transcription elongation factor GreA [Ruminococcaceae bacterium]|nr:transcription elongation factor GreA [Oscillospiraceae bacterium]
MAEKQVLLTEEGKKKLEAELEELRSRLTTEISEKIKEARGFGDLSENSEYDEAKNEQAQIKSRITQLEDMLKHAVVIDESSVTTDVVRVGVRVKVRDVEYDEVCEYQIVGSAEANPKKNLISDESPVGKGLLGHKVGDTVAIEAPGGIFSYEVLDISI